MAEKKLRQGFTTGAAAAAATKAALLSLLTCQHPRQVQIRFLTGETRVIPVHEILDISRTCCQASVIKDAGDDPDITHKARIGAVVTLVSGSPGVTITGGRGVGRVTQPGLEVNVGEPAINPGPRQMIQEAVVQAYQQLALPLRHHVQVEVYVPEGEALAQKTLNARLGILGGISILGTTGIVRPLSHEAYIATIRSGVSVARARGIRKLVFSTGRRSERHAMDLFPCFEDQAFIQTGDFFKAGIEAVLAENDREEGLEPVEEIIYTVFFGKAVKMAMGVEHTHAAKSELTLKTLGDWTLDLTRDADLAGKVCSANTARQAFSLLHPGHPELLARVATQAIKAAGEFAKNRLGIRVIILDFDGRPAMDSQG